jgi:hypothetical protein
MVTLVMYTQIVHAEISVDISPEPLDRNGLLAGLNVLSLGRLSRETRPRAVSATHSRVPPFDAVSL